MAVIDASVLVAYLAGGEHSAAAGERMLADRAALWAPHLVDAEVGHVFRRGVAAGEIKAPAARAALADLAAMPLLRASHVGLLERAWELRSNLTFYDALYVALAERLDEPLLTLDARMAGASGTRARVEVIGA